MSMNGNRVKMSNDQETHGRTSDEQLLEKKPKSCLVPISIGLFLLITCTSLLLIVVVASDDYRMNPSWEWLRGRVRMIQIGSEDVSSSSFTNKESAPYIFTKNGSPPKDKFLGGLLATGFDEASCLSRYQSALYHKPSPHTLSPYLVGRLRKYEALHRKCGPHTALYNKSIEQLKSNHSTGPSAECNYVVWLPYNGFGNRVLTIVSTFLYALLNNRVLLIHVPEDFADLLCEPFPGTSWVLPSDFPVDDLDKFDIRTPQSYGNMLRNRVINNEMRSAGNVSLPPYVYLHLEHDYSALDKLFFCEDAQQVLQRFQWQLLKSDNYFVPGLFLLDDYYGDELRKLFPQRDVVFHHLGRYLLHPSNVVWGYIMRYYHAYLANADERVGIQIRIFAHLRVSFDAMLAQIMNCSSRENLLPEIDYQVTGPGRTDPSVVKLKAILVTTLYTGYFDKLRNMYYERSTKTGEIVGVYQASHEEAQRTDQQSHNVKAWSEMYLLSFSDVLITSAWSTFGYVAQGLGGLRPWILLRTSANPDPPCRRAMSMEPCFHSPPSYDCKAHTDVDKGAVLRHVRHCEDAEGGLKLVD